MKHLKLSRRWWPLVLIAGLAIQGEVWAVDRVLTGEFDGSEPKTANLPGNCGNSEQLGYQVITPVQVTATGSYSVTDAFSFNGVDITALIYQGSFDPANPQANLVTSDGIDLSADVSLSSGVNYTLVVQQWCGAREGAWAITFSGPGSVNSSTVANVPSFTMGSFTSADPTLAGACGNSRYQQYGPIQVSRSGTYYYTDISIVHAIDTCLQIYTAPVNTANPSANRVALLDDIGQVELQTGQNYYFVVQALDEITTGDYFFVLVQPADFRLNPGMAGSWYNKNTAGQGFFLDVFDAINQVFLAWFTFDLSRPAGAVPAQIGDAGHRWLTAFGPFSGDTANLSIEWTVGGVFDAASPAPTQSEDGTISLQFDDCESGTITYNLGTAGASGSVPIERISNDSVALCESLIAGPGMPGEL